MMDKNIKSKDILLMLLYLPGENNDINEPIIGRTRITKMIFIFEQEILKKLKSNVDDAKLPEFIAYNYGPYSKELIDDINFLSTLGFIEKKYLSSGISKADEAELTKIIETDMTDDICDEYGEISIEGNPHEDSSKLDEFQLDDDDDYGANNIIFDTQKNESYMNEVEYLLTKKGIDYVKEKIVCKFDDNDIKLLAQFKKKINSLKLSTILDYVYNKYPDYAEKSLIKDKYLR